MKLLKFILKWAFRLFLMLVVVVVFVAVFKDTILRSVVERQIRAETGMEAHIGRFKSRLTSGVVQISDLRLYNTAKFGGESFLDMPELYLEYDPASVSSGKLGFKVVQLNLAAVNVVRNRAGEMNIDLQPLQKKLGGAEGGKSSGAGHKAQQYEFGGIGTLRLTLGRVTYKDLGNPANNRVQDLGIRNEVFKNIKSEEDLYGVLLMLMLRHGVTFGGELGLGLPLKL